MRNVHQNSIQLYLKFHQIMIQFNDFFLIFCNFFLIYNEFSSRDTLEKYQIAASFFRSLLDLSKKLSIQMTVNSINLNCT